MDSFAVRIKILREYLGLTQAEFGERVGKEENTIYSWEAAKNIPHGNTIRLIAEKTGCNFHWLRTGQGEMFMNKVGAVSGRRSEIISDLRAKMVETVNKFYEHPGIRIWALAGAGEPWEPSEGAEPIETISVSNFLNPKHRDAFRVRGDSMEPVIRHNALVFCDFRDRTIWSGEIFALNINKEGLVVKELRTIKADVGEPTKVMAYSYNEQRYPASYYSHEELIEGNMIVGRITLIHQETNK